MRVFRFPSRLLLLARRCYHSGNGGQVFGHQEIVQRSNELDIPPDVNKNRAQNASFYLFANEFRRHGHRAARINPLADTKESIPELNAARYCLDEGQKINVTGLFQSNSDQLTIRDGIEFMQKVYCGETGYEFMYIEDEAERDWFASRIEQLSTEAVPDDYKVQIALEMAKSQNFDHFLASKFPTLKRYGGEGCESMMAFFLELLNSCATTGVDHIVIGMGHRGRNNLLAGPLGLPPVLMFRKIKGLAEFPPTAHGATGDVLAHLAISTDLDVQGRKVHCVLLPNPSHLEAVNPMAVGKARGKQKSLLDYDYSSADIKQSSRALCVQIHGDAAISGQGINQETLGFSQVPHFRTGGSVHLITNNQVGFTTPQDRGRSSRYSSDVAKMIGAPVIHVNGDHPEAVLKAARLAVSYRQRFHKDVFIDLLCFRRWGHNELDDPTFTNPLLYDIIHNRRSIPDMYTSSLIEQNVLNPSVLKSTIDEHTNALAEDLKQAETHVPPQVYLNSQWASVTQAEEVITTWDTGMDTNVLKYVGARSVQVPTEFNIHPHLAKTFMKARVKKVTAGTGIDWATAEAMAVGSLLYQGFGVRFSGEDVGRGTFSHRHMMLVDQTTGQIIIPLNGLTADQKEKLEIANTTLSEEAVLAFEYGYSLEHPNNLTIWEAQFGDFFNGAQIVIDTMVASGEAKWMTQSGLVMLLPHGMDGAGPEHSSCRIERFLQMTDSNENDKVDGDYNNFQFVNPTTPAQYFHLLRRQMVRNFRKPLIVASPKVLLRLPAATSTLNEMGPGTTFLPVIGDPSVKPADVKKLVFVSGKHFYTLKEKRDELNIKDTAIIRIESLCPFPVQELRDEVAKYSGAKSIVWSQEEHRNMGAWTFIKPRFENLIGRKISYVGRGPSPVPAVGVSQVHREEAAKLISDTFK